ncbi:unnamed protein product [Calicophoron daubneyi]|uniref:Rab5 GDP/GTP exchange factor n=1 Tax=Calicophoron daubneyi TaxID=300641 RepID=A0AAV2TLW9_CALDB
MMSVSRVQNSNLRCRNNCGYFGNPSWDGYCSVCYREAYLQQSQSRNIAANITNVSTQAFSRFEAKRKQLAGKGANTLKQIFRLNKDDSREKNTNLPEESYQAAAEFNKYLSGLRASVSADISRQVSKLLEDLETMGGSHIDQYSVVVQNFYHMISERIANTPLYVNVSEAAAESLLNAIERFITTWIYCWAFASPITDDESVDLRLQEKIRSLHWVTPPLLDSPINPNSPAEKVPLEAATFALIRINSVYATEEKLNQIVQCCTSVFEALEIHYKNSHNGYDKNGLPPSEATTANQASTTRYAPSASAESSYGTPAANTDDFLPTLIWVVLNANPPLLHSNLQFIMRFANQKKLNSGQAAFFFTNLSCAAHFLTKLTHESLSMTEEEFTRCMRAGLPVVRRHGFDCVGEKILNDNEIRLLDLEDSIKQFDSNLSAAESDIRQFDLTTKQHIKRLQQDYPVHSDVVDQLDPRHLDSPDVLLLEPPPSRTSAPSTTQSANPPSLLDMEVEESVKRCLPDPILPSPYNSGPQKSS